MKSKFLTLALAVFTVVLPGSCKKNDPSPEGDSAADLVVYGKVFTSVKNDKDNVVIADAFAVKDGKFVYVGDKKGAADFIKEGKTQIVDHEGKGIIIPGCYEGHAHYMMGNGMKLMGGPMLDLNTDPDQLKQAVATAYRQAKDSGKSSIYGFGWAYQMHVENERGSIEVGKYADFVLADKNVLTCSESEIHETKVLSTYFEGKKVYRTSAD